MSLLAAQITQYITARVLLLVCIYVVLKNVNSDVCRRVFLSFLFRVMLLRIGNLIE